MRRQLFIACLVTCTVSPFSVRADNLIVPGARIGSVRIGMSADELYQVMGTPSSTQSLDDGNYYIWSGLGDLKVFVYPNGRVDSIITTDPVYVTREGVHVGDSALVLQAKL